MGLFRLLFGAPRSSAVQETLKPIHLAPSGTYNFEVVGEASYQHVLDRLCGGKCEEGYDLQCIAQLCFQEDNPHDPNAVAVLIDRKVVGYVARHSAQRIRSEILRVNPLERPITCYAKIVGGWKRAADDQGHYGVKLSLAQPLRVDR